MFLNFFSLALLLSILLAFNFDNTFVEQFRLNDAIIAIESAHTNFIEQIKWKKQQQQQFVSHHEMPNDVG